MPGLLTGKATISFKNKVSHDMYHRFQAGNIPRSMNIPYSSIIDPNAPYKLLSENELVSFFSKFHFHDSEAKENILEDDRPIIASCGSGVTACIIYLGLLQAKRKGSVGVFDGSWTEYADRTRVGKN